MTTNKDFETFLKENPFAGLSKWQSEFLRRYVEGTWKLNEHGEIDVIGRVDTDAADFIKIPVQFGTVTGDFEIAVNAVLTTLKGCPHTVGRDFKMFNCGIITTLEFGPTKVGRNYDCSGCRMLETLHGMAKEIGRELECIDCPRLKNLDYLPKKWNGNFYFDGCNSLPDELKALGEDQDMVRAWQKSGLTLKEFTHKKRGQLSTRVLFG